jgi:hypothetical protein
MQSDQSTARRLLNSGAAALNDASVSQLQEIIDKNHQSLLALMSYLSFQDVLRQRLEQVQSEKPREDY